MKSKFLFSLILLATAASAQIGGNGTYGFLYVFPNARIASLGGSAIATPDADINLVSQNPALLNKSNHNQVGLNFVNYFTDISAGEANFSRHSDSLNTSFAGGIQYMNYGNFIRTAPDGQELGTFSAGEYNFHFSAARTYKQFQYGGTLKFIYSNLESYNSTGVAVDLAGAWFSKDRLFTTTLLLSNAGTQISSYRTNNYEPIPYNLQAGFTKKFEHSPFRFGIILQHLERPGQLLYQIDSRNNRNINLETGEPIKESFNVLQKGMAHVIFNTELLLGKSLNFRFGYNALRKREIGLSDARTMAGFTWGFGIKLNRFMFSYGFGGYIPGKNTNSFSIITRLDDFRRKKN